MAQPLMALGVNTPDINTVGNYLGAQKAATDMKSEQINQAGAQQQQEAASLEHIAQLGFGVMGGKLDGPIDPKRLDTMITLLGPDNPVGQHLKENPELLRTITQGSAAVAAQSQDAQKFELAKKQFDLDLQKATADVQKARYQEISPGATLHDVTGASPDFTAPDKPDDYEQYAAQETAAGRQPIGRLEYAQALKGQGLSVQTNPDGTMSVTMGGSGKALTEGQSKDLVFVTRASGALDTLNNLGDKLTSLGEDIAGKVPYGKFAQSEEYQKAKQAGDEFISAILRKDSGAAITPDERLSYGGTYLPEPGDKPGVLKQKEAARNRAVKAIAMGLPAAAILSLEQNDVALPNTADTKNPDSTTPDAPAVGSVEDGYQFKGGDPSDQRNWTAVNSSGNPDQRSGMN